MNPFLNLRAITFGAAVFTFGWAWVGSSEWEFHKYIFLAGLLLASSVLTLVKRVWTNFMAAVLCGYLPVQLAYEFWMFAKSAEVPIFSLGHFAFFKGVFESIVTVYFVLTAIILACSANSLMRLAAGRETSNDV